jgi:cyclin G-associated kinase
MSDFFKSAFGFIGGSSGTRDEHDFVGQYVELGNQKLRVKKKIAEGRIPHPLTLIFDYF